MTTRQTSVEEYVKNKVNLIGFNSDRPWMGQMPNGQVIEDAPSTRLYESAVVLRGGSKKHNDSHVMYGGAYDKNDIAIDNMDVIRGPNETVFIRKPIEDADISLSQDFGAVFGWNFGHFGHFITETLSYMWASKLLSNEVNPFIISPFMKQFSKNETSLMKMIFPDALPSPISVDTKFHRLISPVPLFRPRRHVFSYFGEYCREIGDLFIKKENTPSKIFITRTKLSDFTRVVINEMALEEKLRDSGYTIVHPQEISTSDQLTLFRNAKIIVGVAGSFFHLSPLAAGQAKRICLSNEVLNGNFILTDAVSDGSAFYINCLKRAPIDDPKSLYCDVDMVLQTLRDI